MEIETVSVQDDVAKLNILMDQVEKVFFLKVNGESTLLVNKHGVYAYRLNEPIDDSTKVDFIKLEAVFDCHQDKLMTYFSDKEIRFTWDNSLSDMRPKVHAWTEGSTEFTLQNSSTKPTAMGLISGRDFCDLVRTKRGSNDDLIGAVTSVKCDLVPKIKGVVRAHNVPSGMIIKRGDRDGANTDTCCTLIWGVHVDIGGGVPSWLVNKTVAGHLHAALCKLAKFVKSNEPKQ